MEPSGTEPRPNPPGWPPQPPAAPSGQWGSGQPPPPSYQQPWPGPPPATAKTDGFAIAGLIFAILGGLCFSLIFSFIGWRRIKASNGAKDGLGLVKASWAICLLWIVGLVALVALAVVFEEDNADDYTGPERDVALVIDRFEKADPAQICDELLTPAQRDAFAATEGSCEEALTIDGVAAEIDITSISIDGAQATVTAEELGEQLVITLVNDGTSWRIDDLWAG